MKSKIIFENSVFKIESSNELEGKEIAKLYFKGKHISTDLLFEKKFNIENYTPEQLFEIEASLLPPEIDLWLINPAPNKKFSEFSIITFLDNSKVEFNIDFYWSNELFESMFINPIKIINRFYSLLKASKYKIKYRGNWEDRNCNFFFTVPAQGNLYTQYKMHEDFFMKLFDQAYEDVRQGAITEKY